MSHSQLRFGLIALAMVAIAGCGEDNTPEGQLPERPDDKLIEQTGRPAEQTEAPTLQSGKGGVIPGYEPTKESETASE